MQTATLTVSLVLTSSASCLSLSNQSSMSPMVALMSVASSLMRTTICLMLLTATSRSFFIWKSRAVTFGRPSNTGSWKLSKQHRTKNADRDWDKNHRGRPRCDFLMERITPSLHKTANSRSCLVWICLYLFMSSIMWLMTLSQISFRRVSATLAKTAVFNELRLVS